MPPPSSGRLGGRHAARGRCAGGARSVLARRPRNQSGEERQMKYRIIMAIAVTAGLLTSACNGPSPAKASTPVESERLVVAVATAHKQDMIRTAQAQGALFP